jgi:hypothetical protein
MMTSRRRLLAQHVSHGGRSSDSSISLISSSPSRRTANTGSEPVTARPASSHSMGAVSGSPQTRISGVGGLSEGFRPAGTLKTTTSGSASPNFSRRTPYAQTVSKMPRNKRQSWTQSQDTRQNTEAAESQASSPYHGSRAASLDSVGTIGSKPIALSHDSTVLPLAPQQELQRRLQADGLTERVFDAK